MSPAAVRVAVLSAGSRDRVVGWDARVDSQAASIMGKISLTAASRFSGVGGSMPDALAAAADLISRGKLHIPVEKS